MVSFRGQKKLGQRPDRSPFRGLIQNFRRASPPLSYAESPRNVLVWNRVRIWRIGRHTPNKNSQEYPLLPGLSLVLIPTSCDVWHWRLYIRDPARKNQSVLFTRWMDLCIQRFLLRGNLFLRVRTLIKILRESRRESHSCFQQWRTDFARMLSLAALRAVSQTSLVQTTPGSEGFFFTVSG